MLFICAGLFIDKRRYFSCECFITCTLVQTRTTCLRASEHGGLRLLLSKLEHGWIASEKASWPCVDVKCVLCNLFGLREKRRESISVIVSPECEGQGEIISASPLWSWLLKTYLFFIECSLPVNMHMHMQMMRITSKSILYKHRGLRICYVSGLGWCRCIKRWSVNH